MLLRGLAEGSLAEDLAEEEVRSVPISVVISTVDRPARLARCLTALLNCSRRPSEVVVVDQGHAELTVPVTSAARKQGLPVVRLTQPRLGLSASQNAGVRAACSAVVAVVDDDCVPDVRWLEVVERSFGSGSAPLLLTGRVLPLPPEDDCVVAVASRTSTRRAEWSRPPLPWHIGTGGNFAVHRGIFLDVGGNDERLGAGSPGRAANDIDLFYRLVAAGAVARYEPDLVVRHQRSTLAEYRGRRGSYGFGVGAMLGLWLQRGEMRALTVLAGWLRLRVRLGHERRRDGGLGHEARVLAGTAAGLVHGLRAGGTNRRLRRG